MYTHIKAYSKTSNDDCLVEDDLLLYASKTLGIRII